jgi:CheY-like chemotaxis protein
MVSKVGSFRILVIDDDVLVLTVLEAMLSSAGYDVRVTDDPQNALELVWKEDFDAVITDLGMPTVDGWAVARQVKAKNTKTPVIVVTGWGVKHEKRDLLSRGVDLLFSKPVDLPILLGAVEELMAHSIRRPGRNRKHKRFPGKWGESVSIVSFRWACMHRAAGSL